MQKSYILFIVIIFFASVLFIINTISQFDIQISNNRNSRPIKNLIEWEVPKVFFEEDESEEKPQNEQDNQQNQDNKNSDVKNNEAIKIGKKMTREELGHHGWAMLHMIAQTFPNKVDDDFLQKTNVFLNLFGQFYPCKECGGHFLEMIKGKPFQGHTKQEFILYVCELHNIVNVRLGKDVVDCIEEYPKIWGESCGCFESNNDDDDN